MAGKSTSKADKEAGRGSAGRLAETGKRPFITLLCLALILFAGGCATVADKSVGGKGYAEVNFSRLPFPSSPPRAGTAIEPLVVGYENYRDPLIGLNKAVFAFNDVTYRYLLIPLSKGYVKVIPGPVRQSVDNFFYNIKTPIYAVNHLLQLKPDGLGRNLLRFGLNTTVGLLGLFDPAKAWFDLDRRETHFDATLARYGAGYGIYLVLPVFGPSNLRNSVSLVADHFLNPIVYLTDNPERSGIQGYDFFQKYAPGADRYEILRRKSEDPYIFFRNLYLQGVQRDVAY